MNQNYKFIISYDGARYSGWQSQGNTDATIQGKLEAVLSKMTGTSVELIGAGRTDAGVHAKAMTANATLYTDLTTSQIRNYLNFYLPCDICVLEVHEAAPRFHSRYHATGKTYTYTCYIGPLKPIFDRNYVYVLTYAPDIKKMQKAAEFLTGEHDFRSFCGNPRFKKSTIRNVDYTGRALCQIHIPRKWISPEYGTNPYRNLAGSWVWKAQSRQHDSPFGCQRPKRSRIYGTCPGALSDES